MRPQEKAKDTRGTVLRLWDYLRHQKVALIATVLLVAASSSMGLLGPYLTGRAIDEFIRPGDLPGLARLCTLMIGVYLVTALSIWVQRYVMVGASQRAIQEIRNDLFAKLQTLSLRFFARTVS